jgi:hypothetical protein
MSAPAYPIPGPARRELLAAGAAGRAVAGTDAFRCFAGR